MNNILPRPLDAHKGSMGHAALIAGSYGMAGAAILASRACLRSGVGKLTLHTPAFNLPIIQASVPEAIVHTDSDADHFTTPFPTTAYQALAIGPGLSTHHDTARAVLAQIRQTTCPLVLDADALNILAQSPGSLSMLPTSTILTPHKGELRRLIGETASVEEELQTTIALAQKYHIIIIIKGPHSAICAPDGTVHYNTTGNPGMATAGSGDVLTGIILGLLARGHQPVQAAQLGTCLHGLAGDLAADVLGQESLIASDIIKYLPQAFKCMMADV